MKLFTYLALMLIVGLSNGQSLPFDAREATISSVHSALFPRQTTCRAVVSSFIARIEAHNPLINAIIALNPDALSTADALDEALASGNATGLLFCIPILLKDNYDAVPMATTAGSLALNASTPLQDGPTVSAFRAAGAVILGKTNLHEFALEGLGVSSLGGQTLNPYDLTRTAGGSSSGTGAAIAASFAVFGTGTDTVNSLRSPASANSLYSFRPTRGLISRAGIIPVSFTQDTAGAIGRSLSDIATALTVMASVGQDGADNDTSAIPASVIGTDYTSFLSSQGSAANLTGTRIGVLEGFFNHTASNETTPVNKLMESVMSRLRKQGATMVPITDTATYDATAIATQLDVQPYEFRELLSQYLSSPSLRGPHPRSMSEIYVKNYNTTSPNFVVIPHQYQHIQRALVSSTSDSSYIGQKAQIAKLTQTLHSTMHDLQLSALIYPEQKNLVVPVGSASQVGRNGILAALTGSPVITIPIGFSEPSDTAPIGIPVGMEILGLPFSEGKLLWIAKGIDDRLHARRMPVTAGLNGTLDATIAYYTEVPSVTPLKNIPTTYPLGRF
ncbi:uncharacterized protein A1O9_04615 [Exophiala aquamarina CBS 119918]|uniref:Amidase domain-containing protein n=1 Tax=Exophiala aquamarina CBS 119918 TaxID=1182545 RepID=A0A072PJ84_9EURO|nr:uncharacterized protein A1O9_04615 [Exophiala aquamarina CBS 119918]KEF59767.1 hypothetical protein A1O9_04615 [Exophiala aquamarina CBS 119918]